MEILVSMIVGALVVSTIVLFKKVNSIETKKDPYEKYRNTDGLLRRKVEK